MPVHLSTDRASSHVPVLSSTAEEISAGIDGILDTEALPAHTPSSTSSTVRASSVSSTKLGAPAPSHSQLPPPPGAIHFHTESTSTSASESAGSSPTTAPSLTGSVHNSETPTTSPDTPASNQFSAASGSPTITLASRLQTFDPREPVALPRPAPVDLPRPSTGIKGKRNLKNLAVDTSSATAFGRAISTATLPLNRGDSTSMISGAPTPAVLKQPKFLKSKRSTLGLTLVTPSSSGSNKIGEDAHHAVPPTPSLVRPHALRHFPSSPSLMIRSPNGQPQQVQLSGMESLNSALTSGSGVAVGFHPPPTTEEEDEINFDVPQSQEPKVETYPDGPICIYDPHVYLYYEPSAEQASGFDVVFNVAEEVPNPFKPKPASDAAEDETSAETPKASTPLIREPEYFHIPWQHNTDIVPELYNLATLIDDRVKQGKKILIHCQCGVSRSASLIVAYGLYKNPSMTVQEAYDAVKRRSKWINPNMSLIMQLQEFRSQQLKTSAGMPPRGMRLKSPGQMSVRSPLDSAHSRSRSSVESEDGGPKSAPLDSHKHTPSLQHLDSAEFADVSPGPSSAPSGFPWPADRDADLSDRDSASTYATPLEAPLNKFEDMFASNSQDSSDRRPQSQPASQPRIEKRPAPLKLPQTHLSRFQAINAKQIAESPRAAEFSMATARLPPSEDMFGLTSPRGNGPSFPPAPPQTLSLQPAHLAAASRPRPLSTVQEQPSAAPPTQPLFSPRGQEFGMTSVVPGTAFGETFGLTSPRNDSFAKTSLPPPTASVAPIASAAPRILHSDGPLDQQPPIAPTRAPPPPPAGVFSPRSDEFGMNTLKIQDDQDMLGLTSPRFGSFAPQLPQHNSSRATAMSALHPELPTPESTQQKAGDRAKLRSKLGMSTSSSYDMRSEYILAAKARELRPTLQSQDSFQRILQAQDDLSDALMSPRATEFTANPFRDAFPINDRPTSPDPPADTTATVTPRKADPRSPAQKGASPIVRNIFDVIS